MTIKEPRDFIYKNYYSRTGFTKENSYYSIKHQKKKIILYHSQPNQFEKYLILVNQRILSTLFTEKNNNKKLVKQSKVIAQQPKTIENPNTVDIKSSIIERLKNSRRLSKTIKQAEKVPQIGVADNLLYSEVKKVKIFYQKN